VLPGRSVPSRRMLEQFIIIIVLLDAHNTLLTLGLDYLRELSRLRREICRLSWRLPL
jgi:hypothetical protein